MSEATTFTISGFLLHPLVTGMHAPQSSSLYGHIVSVLDSGSPFS
jgi:hypothetical protein